MENKGNLLKPKLSRIEIVYVVKNTSKEMFLHLTETVIKNFP